MANPPAPNDRSAGRLSDPLTGRFRIVNATGQVNWSEDLFRIYGFAAGEVRPTLALMQTHQHHDDRAGWAEALRDASRLPGPVTRWHRIITATRKDRNLVTTFRPHVEQGRVVGIDGLSIDITDQIRQDRADEVTRAVVRAAETRAVIDQAKGILMATLDLDEDRSFELLRWYSSYANVKVRNIASILVERLASTQGSEIAPHLRITELLAEMGGAAPAFPDIAAELTEVSDAAERELPTRIPAGLLPRTLVRAVTEASVSISIADYLAPDYPLVFVNPAFEALTGYRAEDILGRNCRFLQNDETDPRQITAMRAALAAGRDTRVVLRNVRRDGSAFWNEIHFSPVRDEEGRLTHYIGYQTDVSERIARQQQLERLAYSDAETGLPNEAALERHVQRRIESPGGTKHFALNLVEWPLTLVGGQAERPLEGLAKFQELLNTGAFVARVSADAVALVTTDLMDADELAARFAAALGGETSPPDLRIAGVGYPADGRSAAGLLAAARKLLASG